MQEAPCVTEHSQGQGEGAGGWGAGLEGQEPTLPSSHQPMQALAESRALC